MMAAAIASVTLFSPFLPSPGFHESCLSLNWRIHKKQLARKAGPVKVTAKFELNPPPYPMFVLEFTTLGPRVFRKEPLYLREVVNALEPHMSRTTFEYHWGKHHRAYVDNLNKQIVGTELDELTLEDIILITYNQGNLLPPFNNAAQAWNHQFFWESMKPGGGGEPSGELLKLINRDFGSFEAFVKKFKAAAATQFGSGWAWLAYKANRLDVGNASNPHPSDEDKKLVIVKTPNAVNPLVWDYSPLLTIDVWEHAYYLDFRNRRPDYISIFMEKLVSWEAVSSRLEAAQAQAAEREKEEERKKREEEEEYQAGNEIREMYVETTDSEGD